MSSKSGIEWTEATWNPVTGCTKVSQGCKHCYAEREWPRMQHLPRFAGRAFTDVQCHPDRLDQPLRWRKPRRIFVNSMSDLFHESVPDLFIDKVFAVMCEAKWHCFQVLTKRPERMLAYFNDELRGMRIAIDRTNLRAPVNLPVDNVWLGVSVEDQQTADERIPLLLQTPAAVRWISAEPLLGPIDMYYMEYAALNWIVVGGESGPNARPMHPDWARSIRDWCAQIDVPFFFKQWGSLLPKCQADTARMYYPKVVTFPSPNNPSKKNTYFDIGKKRAGNLLDGKKWEEYPND